jgi:hypothetical protein
LPASNVAHGLPRIELTALFTGILRGASAALESV